MATEQGSNVGASKVFPLGFLSAPVVCVAKVVCVVCFLEQGENTQSVSVCQRDQRKKEHSSDFSPDVFEAGTDGDETRVELERSQTPLCQSSSPVFPPLPWLIYNIHCQTSCY
jgi:hypothetical protein